jgi:hypothetical protein
MKATKAIFLLAVLTGTMVGARTASAQFKPMRDDGITASPRARQLLDDQKNRTSGAVSATMGNTVAFASNNPVVNDGIAASPRVRQMINERAVLSDERFSTTEVASVGYRATGPDGVTASPKVREQLNQQSSVLMVAPVK